MIRVFTILALLCAVVVPTTLASKRAIALPATAEFPALSGRVVDDAGVLDAGTREALRQKLAAHEATTTDQFVVATVKSLGDQSIEDYANRLFRHWQLGQRGRNNGVLLLHAPTERKIRIEVGYGLEGALTDALSKSIIQNAITPRFKAGDFSGGLIRGVDEIIKVLSREAEPSGKRAEPLLPSWLTKLAPGLVVPAVLLLLPVVFLILLQRTTGFLGPLHGVSPALARKARRSRRCADDRSNSSSDSSARSSSSSSSSSSSDASGSSSDSFSSGGGDSGGGGSSGDY
jgi:uncharacterized protein